MVAVLSQTAPETCARALGERGYRVLRLPPCPALAAPVASHPDMLFCRIGDRLFAPAEILSCGASMGLTLTAIPEALSPVYPGDILLNALAAGRHLFCHPRVSSAIREAAEKCGMTIHTVRQGYAHCGALALGERAMITADPSLSRAGAEAGLSVLTLPRGEIYLPGYAGNGGLCGGSGGVDEERRTLFLCGTPPFLILSRIEDHCAALGYGVVCLPAPVWTDVGGILFLPETAPFVHVIEKND